MAPVVGLSQSDLGYDPARACERRVNAAPICTPLEIEQAGLMHGDDGAVHGLSREAKVVGNSTDIPAGVANHAIEDPQSRPRDSEVGIQIAEKSGKAAIESFHFMNQAIDPSESLFVGEATSLGAVGLLVCGGGHE